MAEVLGIVAASGQFVEQSIKIVKLSKKVRDKFKDAPQELEAWRNELEILQGVVDKIYNTPALLDKDLENIIAQCTRIGDKLLNIFSIIDFAESDAFSHKSWRVVVSLAREEEMRDLFSALERWKLTLSIKLSVSTAVQSNQNHAQITSALEDVKESFRPGTDEERCLQSLFITDPLSDREGLVTTKGHQTPGTFEWIPTTKQYQEWDAAQNGLLWISGPPGKGKTMISIFLSKRLELTKPNDTVIWFFCDNKIASRNNAVNVVRGLMTQLISMHPRLLACLLPVWKIQQSRLFQANSFESMWMILLSMLEALENDSIYCVLDALDECDDDSLSSILFKIQALFNPSQGNDARNSLKLIVASREQPMALPQALSKFPRITLNKLEHDIKMYISERVNYLADLKGIQGLPMQQRIETALREGAKGTFLWVSYVTQDLESKTLSEIDTALTQLPRGLYAIYERIVSQINPDSKESVSEMLMWILLATRPLNISELCDATQVTSTEFLTREQVCLGYIQLCGHLLQLQVHHDDREMWVSYGDSMQPRQDPQGLTQEMSKTVLGNLQTTFLHQSAKDFLLNGGSNHPLIRSLADTNGGHLAITQRLLLFLEEHTFVLSRVHRGLTTGPSLLDYALENWSHHMRNLREGFESLFQKHVNFFGKSSRVRDLWWWWRTGTVLQRGPEVAVPLLFVACQENLYRLIEALIQSRGILSRFRHKGRINSSWGAQKDTPLHVATRGRHFQAIQTLLGHGADVSIVNSHGHTPLHVSIDRHADESIYTLLSTSRTASKVFVREAKCHRRNYYFLHKAAKAGHEEICRDLIVHQKYDINQTDSYSKRPVHLALKGGHVDLARRMATEWGADLTPEIELFRIVIKDALWFVQPKRDSKKALNMLVCDLGCDINATDAEGNTIMHYPSLSLNALNTMTTMGLAINWTQQNSHNETFLHCNTEWVRDGRLLVEFLRRSELSINTCDSKGKSVLHVIVDMFPRYKFPPILLDWIQMLLDFGANRYLKDNQGNTVFDMASSCLFVEDRNSRSVVEKLIEFLITYSTVAIDARQVDPRFIDEFWDAPTMGF